jgi:hypothetical protein
MDLSERAKAYVGGQMEVQNPVERYFFRGEIETISADNEELRIHFKWVAKGEGYPPFPKRWVKSDKLDYAASLGIYQISDIGEGRIALLSPITNETVVLFPPNGSKLDPSKVEGLEGIVEKD